MTPQQLAETAARSLRGALQLDNIVEQSAISRKELLDYWRQALIALGVTNVPTDYCAFVLLCDRLATPRRMAVV